MRGYNEVLEVGPGWKWHNELTIRLPDGNDVHFHHGKSANIMTVKTCVSIKGELRAPDELEFLKHLIWVAMR